MKKIVKYTFIILVLLCIIGSFRNFVFCNNDKMYASASSSVKKEKVPENVGIEFNPDNIVTGSALLTTQTDRIWNTIIVALRVAAFSGILIAGVRYLFSSADQKADLKKGLFPIVMGCVLVFASSIVIDFVKRVFFDTIS